MDIEDALRIIDQLLGTRGLNNVQEFVLRQSWQNRSYAKMAAETRYDETYLKYVGFKLWKLLSEVMQQEVTKGNLQATVERYARTLSPLVPGVPSPIAPEPSEAQPLEAEAEIKAETEVSAADPSDLPIESSLPESSPVNAVTIATLEKALSHAQQDWGDAVDVSQFCGRVAELAQLQQWILRDGCRLVAVLGMGGMGKSTVTIRFAEQVSNSPTVGNASQDGNRPPFDLLIWRSLRNAPPIDSLLADLIQFLSHQQATAATLPADTQGRIAQLMQYLRQSRCLVILDNLETVLQSGERVGQYQPGYEGYGELLRQVGELRHQSCLLITSREKPREIALSEGSQAAVRSLLLSGLNAQDGQAVIQQRGDFAAPDSDWQMLVQHYAGNPLALKIVAAAIDDLFNGSIPTFLAYVQQQRHALMFDDIRDLLTRQFDRLSDLEQEVMYWLAINREFVSLSELHRDLVSTHAKQRLLETLRSLGRRSLIETKSGRYTQQPVVMEYATERLVQQVWQEICQEIRQEMRPVGSALCFNRYALIKAESADYIRDSQIRLIFNPLIERLRDAKSDSDLEQFLKAKIADARHQPGYAAGNLLNLLRQMQIDLSGYDFSDCCVWQAYLQDVNLHHVNFTRADLSRSVFIQTFSYVMSVAISPDGQSIATGDGSGQVRLWQTADGQPLRILQQGQTSWIWSLAWNPSGTILAQGSVDQTIRLWNPQTGDCLNTLRGHQNYVRSVAWSPDGSRLASGSLDRTIKLWNPQTGDCLQTLQQENDAIWSIAWSPDGTRLVSGGLDQQVTLWNVATGAIEQGLAGHQQIIRTVAWSPDGTILASGSDDRTLRLWNPKREMLWPYCRDIRMRSGWLSGVRMGECYAAFPTTKPFGSGTHSAETVSKC